MMGRPFAACIGMLLCVAYATACRAEETLQQQAELAAATIEHYVATITAEKNLQKKSVAVSRLADFVRSEDLKVIALLDPAPILSLAQLLNDQEEHVRFWAARLLGDMGTAASPAVPALRDALKQNPPLLAWDAISPDVGPRVGAKSAMREALHKITGENVAIDYSLENYADLLGEISQCLHYLRTPHEITPASGSCMPDNFDNLAGTSRGALRIALGEPDRIEANSWAYSLAQIPDINSKNGYAMEFFPAALVFFFDPKTRVKQARILAGQDRQIVSPFAPISTPTISIQGKPLGAPERAALLAELSSCLKTFKATLSDSSGPYHAACVGSGLLPLIKASRSEVFDALGQPFECMIQSGDLPCPAGGNWIYLFHRFLPHEDRVGKRLESTLYIRFNSDDEVILATWETPGRD